MGAALAGADMRAWVERVLQRAQAPGVDGDPLATPPLPELALLGAALGLSGFERDLVLLLACAQLHADVLPPAQVTPRLALATLSGAHWSAFAPSAPLRRWRIVEPGPGDARLDAPLHLDERALHFLLGVGPADDRVAPFLSPVAPTPLPAGLQALALAHAATLGQRPLSLDGPPGLLPLLAATLARHAGLSLHQLHVGLLPADPWERDGTLALVARWSLLAGAALLVEGPGGGATASLVRDGVPVVLVGGQTPEGAVRVSVPDLSPADRRAVLRLHLGPGVVDDAELDVVCGWFRVPVVAIPEVAAAARGAGSDAGRASAVLRDACRVALRPELGGLATRVEGRSSLADLVTSPELDRVLRELATRVEHRRLVYEEWGYGRTAPAAGVTALFAGPSGTGKTMAASAVAEKLGLDLFRIDLSQVVSKYIGETEKNLARVFDAAEAGSVVLLFDEADALFGQRSAVRDSHDRYANIEVSYLLQRMEQYRGLAVLTTNHREALDPAFTRRLQFVVSFPFPDVRMREEIWRRHIPPAAPRGAIDFGRLARLDLAGGHIRNVALHAAFCAAAAGEPLGMRHLRRGAEVEYAKLDRPFPVADPGAWS